MKLSIDGIEFEQVLGSGISVVNDSCAEFNFVLRTYEV